MPETPILPPGHSASIGPAAQAYQQAMAQQASSPPAETKTEPLDVTMNDAAPESNNSPAPPSYTPFRTGTPSRLNSGANGEFHSNSRATSLHPEAAPASFVVPAQASMHGAPVRQYLNKNVTSSLLEGMKQIAREQPKDPLRVLGEYLLQRSKDVGETT